MGVRVVGSSGKGAAGASWVNLPNVVVTEGGLVVVGGARKVTVACAGAVVDDCLTAFPLSYSQNGGAAVKGTPAGYVIGDAVCKTAGQVEISLTGPALTVLVTYAMTLRVKAFR